MGSKELGLAEALAAAAKHLYEPVTADEVMPRLVRTAMETIPGVEMAGVSIAREADIETVAATDPLVEEIDRVQYELMEGPCVDAMLQHAAPIVVDMRTEQRWPRFAPRAVALGVLSQMGIEIFREGSTLGGLNLYAGRPGAFDDTTRQAAMLFAVHAGLAWNKTMTVTALSSALETRQRIGQAVGIVMQRYGVDEAMALDYLLRVSQSSHTKLREVAQEIVDQVTLSAKHKPAPPLTGRPRPARRWAQHKT